jgi:hypothetical protein
MPSVLFLFRINPENNPNISISFMACVIKNGWISEIFKNNRGIYQGCPLSALVFVISVEIMALRLRENKNINYKFWNSQITLCRLLIEIF